MERIFWLDAARAIAIILVVFTHSHENAHIQSVFFKSLFYSIDRLGVPIFFMISGGLILEKLKTRTLSKFYIKRIPQFFIVLIFWTIITNFTFNLLNNNNFLFSLQKAITNTNGVYPGNYGKAIQMWFMYAIIPIYLIAPFISKIVAKSSTKEIILLITILVFFNQFSNTLRYFKININGLYFMSDTIIVPYLSYFLIGYLIVNRSSFNIYKNNLNFLWLLMLFLPIIILIFIDMHRGKTNGGGLHWYSTSIFILISSIGLLSKIKKSFSKQNIKIVTIISRYSFGIYLSHFLFIYIAQWLFREQIKTLPHSVTMIIYFIIAFVGGLLVTHILMKTKITRYLVA